MIKKKNAVGRQRVRKGGEDIDTFHVEREVNLENAFTYDCQIEIDNIFGHIVVPI